MRLHRLHVENFKSISERTLELPEHGLVIAEGLNEVGKTSMVEALDLLLDARLKAGSKAAKVRQAQPYGTDLPVVVEAEMTIGGVRLVHSKRFLTHPQARLEFVSGRRAGEVLTGEEATDTMAEIWEGTDHTLWRALRLMQASSLEALSLKSSTALTAALDRASRQSEDPAEAASPTAGGGDPGAGGDTLLRAVEKEYDRYWTPTGRPGKLLKDATEELESLQAEHDQAADRLAEVDSVVADLEAAREDLAAQQRSVAELRSRAEADGAALGALEGLQRAVTEAARAERDAGIRRDAAAGALAERRGAIEELAGARREEERYRAASARAEALVEDVEQEFRRAGRDWEEAEEARRLSKEAWDAARARAVELRDRSRLERLSQAVERLTGLQRELHGAEGRLDANPATAALVAKARKADEKLTAARIRLETASPRMSLARLAAGAPGLTVDGRPVFPADGVDTGTSRDGVDTGTSRDGVDTGTSRDGVDTGTSRDGVDTESGGEGGTVQDGTGSGGPASESGGDEPRTASAGGESVDRVVDRPTVVEIAGAWRITVTPASDVDDLSRQVDRASRTLTSLLEEMAVSSVEEARDLLDRRHRDEAAVEGLRERLRRELEDARTDADLEPAGSRSGGAEAEMTLADLVDLRDRIMASSATAGTASAAAGSAPGTAGSGVAGDGPVESLHEVDRRALELEAVHEEAELAEKTARSARDTVSQRRSTAREEASGAASRLRAAREQVERQEKRLESARREAGDEELERAAGRAAEDHRAAAEGLARATEELEEHAPDEVRAAAADSARRLERAAERLGRSKDRRAGLTGQLKGLDRAGRQERFDELTGRLHRSRIERTALARRADAAKLLRDTLVRYRDEEHRRYLEPFTREIERLGRSVFGRDMEVRVDDSLTVTARRLNGAWLEWEQLSTGAKEQLGLVVRLATARLVDPKDGVPVILDDALVYSDRVRTGRVLKEVASGSRSHQVVVLTSAPERYDTVEAVHIPFE